jgi:hypothetical protein
MGEQNSQSIKSDRISKSSLARMAGNIAAGIAGEAYRAEGIWNAELVASESVRLARLIAHEIETGVTREEPTT